LRRFWIFVCRRAPSIWPPGTTAALAGKTEKPQLLKGLDPGIDQSYFLCMLTQQQLAPAMFPVGDLQKEQVRAIAEKAGLPVAKKKDSTGICFIGERKFREFLKQYLPAQPGEMRTLSGKVVGRHEGLMYYTLGQRRGLGIGGADSPALYSSRCKTEPFHFISPPEQSEFACPCRYRYRQPDQQVRVFVQEGGEVVIESREPQRAVTPGQYAVLYQGDVCLGGGVVSELDC